MPQERLLKQTLFAEVSGKRPVGRLQKRWLDYIKDLGWNRLGLHPGEMQSVLVDHSLYISTVSIYKDCGWTEKYGSLVLSCCPCNPLGKTNEEKRRKKN